MNNKIIKPRCPNCGRRQADWVVEAKFTCPKCNAEFIIGDGYVTLLTKTPKESISKIS